MKEYNNMAIIEQEETENSVTTNKTKEETKKIDLENTKKIIKKNEENKKITNKITNKVIEDSGKIDSDGEKNLEKDELKVEKSEGSLKSSNSSRKSKKTESNQLEYIDKEIKILENIAEKHNKSVQVFINPIPYEDLSRAQILSSIQQLKNVLKELSRDDKRRKELLKDTRSSKRSRKLHNILQSLFVIKEEVSSKEDILIKLNKSCQTDESFQKSIDRNQSETTRNHS